MFAPLCGFKILQTNSDHSMIHEKRAFGLRLWRLELRQDWSVKDQQCNRSLFCASIRSVVLCFGKLLENKCLMTPVIAAADRLQLSRDGNEYLKDVKG